MVPFLLQRDKNGFNGEMLFQVTADACRPRQQNVSIFREIALSNEYNSASAEMKRKAERLHKVTYQNHILVVKSQVSVCHH